MSDHRPNPRVAALGRMAAPRLGRVFARERLFESLAEFAASPGVWIAAPPGAGKTTLAATWLEHRQTPVLWLHLDDADADPAALAAALDQACAESLPGPASLPPLRADDLADLTRWLRNRLRYLLPRMATHWTLVLDNMQELPSASPMQAALAEALAELPTGVQWLFVSREPPPAAFTRALARQQLRMLDADALRLDEAETKALIALHGRDASVLDSLAPAQGWAAGLTLMLIGRPPARHLQALDAQDRLFDYFASEVLERMPQTEQQLLMQLAYLPVATAELAVALTDEPLAPELLERLAAQSLFTQRREALSPTYEFHALFRSFLRRRHERATTGQAAREQCLRAARLLLATADTDAGLALLLEAKAWDEAEVQVRRHAQAYVADGRLFALARHIGALPPAHRERLAFWRGFCALDAQPAAALADMELALHRARAAGDAQAQMAAAAIAATALISMGRIRDLDAWIDVLDEQSAWLTQAGAGSSDVLIVPGLLAALVVRRPWHALAPLLADRAEKLLAHEAAVGQRLLLGNLTFFLQWRGETERLDRLLLRLDDLTRSPLAAPATLLRCWSFGILVKTLLGKLDAARDDLQRELALLNDEPALAAQRVTVELHGVLIGVAAGDAASARQHLDRAARALDPGNAADRSSYEHHQGLVALLEGDYAASLRIMRTASESARASGFAVREHITLLSHALAAVMHGELAEALEALERARAHPFDAICRWHQWLGGCVAAYAALVRGDEAQTVSELRRALGAARAWGFRSSPLLLAVSELLPRLAAFALAHDVEPDIARDLVKRHHLKAPPEADERWPWPVRVRAFGRFEVEVQGAPLQSSRKESRRLLELLRLLAAHGTRALAVNRVADALWPDADGDAARNALDNALHRLRKALGGDDRIVLHGGALALNPQRCWTDVDAVERALASMDGSAQSLRALRRLYRAPLLPDIDEPLIAGRRYEVERRVGAVLEATATANEEDSQTTGRVKR